jgi:hypothetical protein
MDTLVRELRYSVRMLAHWASERTSLAGSLAVPRFVI